MADAKPSRPIAEPRPAAVPFTDPVSGKVTLPEPGAGALASTSEYVDKQGTTHVIETYK